MTEEPLANVVARSFSPANAGFSAAPHGRFVYNLRMVMGFLCALINSLFAGCREIVKYSAWLKTPVN